MATACFINVYSGYIDRGATVSRTPREHYEIDEKDVKVGEPLPKWWGSPRFAPVVKAYDGQQLDLELRGKTFSIKVGEEVEIDTSSTDMGYGVICRTYYYVKLISTELIYIGDWQFGSTIRQELAGPIGDGEVWYPNGDHFKGRFHLSYASINGPAYAAEGRYEFADGSWIERAWINTSKDKKPEWWGLHGVFRIQHPKSNPNDPSSGKPDSIAMFLHGGKRYGFELFLGEKPWVKEWYAGDSEVRFTAPEELFHYEVEDFEIDETSKVDCTALRLTLRDGNKVYHIEQQGGSYTTNQYNNSIYEPSTRVTVELPNGDELDHHGDDVRDFKPYDGYVTYSCAKKLKYRTERWEKGERKEAGKWRYDRRFAKQLELPCPIINDWSLAAFVWTDGHIEYSGRIYDGDVVNDRPEGRGVLTLDDGGRYEGEFHEGRCHGKGVFVNEKTGIHQEGTWVKGIYQEPNAATAPIVLHARWGRSHWSVGSTEPWKYEDCDFEAKLGALHFEAFSSVKIARIEKDCITLTHNSATFLLKPGEEVSFSEEIEGREWSDGCVYDGDEYSLELTWKEALWTCWRPH